MSTSVPASEQLKHEDAQTPVVCRDVVTFVQDDLRSHVLRGAAECPRLTSVTHALGEPKVNLLMMAGAKICKGM